MVHDGRSVVCAVVPGEPAPEIGMCRLLHRFLDLADVGRIASELKREALITRNI
jgi:hypothetical protein